MGHPAGLGRKKWPPWVRFGFSIYRLLFCSYDSGPYKHKRGLVCQDARWCVFVTWLRQLFILFTIVTLKPLGFRILTVNSFTSFAVFWLRLLISSIVANNSVCVRSNIVWNRWKSTLKPRSIRVSLTQGNIRKYSNQSHGVCLRLNKPAIANVG